MSGEGGGRSVLYHPELQSKTLCQRRRKGRKKTKTIWARILNLPFMYPLCASVSPSVRRQEQGCLPQGSWGIVSLLSRAWARVRAASYHFIFLPDSTQEIAPLMGLQILPSRLPLQEWHPAPGTHWLQRTSKQVCSHFKHSHPCSHPLCPSPASTGDRTELPALALSFPPSHS